MKILINKCNYLYKKNKEEMYDIEENDSIPYYDEQIENKFYFEDLICRLNTKERLIMTLHYSSNLSTKEISKILKMNHNTVKSIIERAKKKIKIELGGENSWIQK